DGTDHAARHRRPAERGAGADEPGPVLLCHTRVKRGAV
ncbi:MAG: hypothetical protein AVDCRST_MAG88-524, partial [uncultured Thermomicrobiales bacterium]